MSKYSDWKRTKIDDIVQICIKWNNREISGDASMFKIFKINKEYILSEINPKNNKKKCGFCGRHLTNTISYCSNQCKWADRSKGEGEKK